MNTAIKNLFHALVLFFIIILLQNIINTAAELIAISKISIILISCILLMPFCLMFARSEKYFERIAPNINFTLISAFAITISMLIGILSIYSSKMVLELDPKLYYEVGKNLANGSIEFDASNLYHQRALFYTFPIIKLFSSKLISIQIVNLLVFILTSVGYFLLLFHMVSKWVAIIFLFVFLALASHYFAINLPSHDLISVFYFLCFIYIINLRFKINTSLFCISATIILFINNYQRSIGIFIVVALILSWLLFNNQKPLKGKLFIKWIIIIFVLFYCATFLTGRYFKSQQNINNPELSYANQIYSFNGLNTNGSYGPGAESFYNYFSTLPVSLRYKYCFSRYSTQVLDYPIDYLKFINQKGSNLLNNSPYYFSYMDQKFKKKQNAAIMSLISGISKLEHILIYFLAIIGISMIAIFKPKYYHELFIVFPLIFIPLMLIIQVNSSYSYILMPFLIIMSAVGLAYLYKFKTKASQIKSKTFLFKKFGYALLTLILLFIAIFIFSYGYVKINNSRIVNFNRINPELTDMAKANSKLTQYEKAYFLNLVPNLNSDSCQINFKGKFKGGVSFFLKTNIDPENIQLKINGKPLNQKGQISSIPEFKNYFYYFISIDCGALNNGLKIGFFSKNGFSINSEIAIKDMIASINY